MSIGNKKGLGKGIGALINNYDSSAFEAEKLEESGAQVREISIDNIKADPNQPRKTFDQDSLNELAQSIANQGILQPLLVKEIAVGSYVIVAGERRFRAAKIAGVKLIPCIVRNFTDVQRMEVSLIENIQRENLNPVEEAKAYQYLLAQQSISQEELAVKVGKSRPAITNSVRLLSLSEPMLDSLQSGLFTPGHARALLSVENPADREILYEKILNDGISVRQAEAIASDLNNGIRASQNGNSKKEKKSETIVYVEERFVSSTGCRVKIKGQLNQGKVVIPYKSELELERIFQLISNGHKLFEEE